MKDIIDTWTNNLKYTTKLKVKMQWNIWTRYRSYKRPLKTGF